MTSTNFGKKQMLSLQKRKKNGIKLPRGRPVGGGGSIVIGGMGASAPINEGIDVS